MPRVVCISDTHGMHRSIKIPEGDILLHTGDLTTYGKPKELVDFNQWLALLPHRDKVIIAGNHDGALDRQPSSFGKAVFSNAHYLCDEEVTVQGLRIYGAPWTPEFFNWHFMLPRGGWEMRTKWDKIPEGLDILMTHGPPLNKLDYGKHQRASVGCGVLREAVERAKPRFHVFGHIHESYGGLKSEHTTFINCAIMTRGYIPSNEPIVIDV